jgi:hypothetical protein
MQTIREFGDYMILCEKIDKCPCEYDDSISCLALLIGLFSALFAYISLHLNNTPLFSVAFIIIGNVGFWGGILISDYTHSCGVKIELGGKNTNITRLYQFTKNSDYDAEQITKIADEMEEHANKIGARNTEIENKNHAKSAECCDKYKSVITKVK